MVNTCINFISANWVIDSEKKMLLVTSDESKKKSVSSCQDCNIILNAKIFAYSKSEVLPCSSKCMNHFVRNLPVGK